MATLLFFGKLQDVIGKPTETVDIPATINTTLQLRGYLNEHYQLSETLSEQSVRIAINSEIVNDPAPVCNADEIAFLPPVGGG